MDVLQEDAEVVLADPVLMLAPAQVQTPAPEVVTEVTEVQVTEVQVTEGVAAAMDNQRTYYFIIEYKYIDNNIPIASLSISNVYEPRTIVH